ncbi:MAG: response regulator [Sulfuricurvum sp.]
MILKVLVVDDSLIMRRNISKTVEALGHKVVHEAKDGLEAVSLYERLQPDLVMMDITMPEMDGISAVKAIIGLNKEAKIVMVTAHGQGDMVVQAIRSGASGYLLKPLSIVKLRESIRKIFPHIPHELEQIHEQSELLRNEEIVLLEAGKEE